MSADFTPSLNSYTDLTPFRFWCQKVLPLVYEDSLSYYELLCKVIDYLNKTMEDVNLSIEDVEKLHTAYDSLQKYVNDYFDNLDVQDEINNKLDALVEDGTIHDIFNPDVEAILNVANQTASDAIEAIPQNVTNWLNEHVNPESDVVIDDTLSIQGAAADAKKTGDEISALKSDLNEVEDVTIIKTTADIEPDEIVSGYVWYRYNETKVSSYASSKYGYKKYNVADLPSQIIITANTIDSALLYVFVDSDNNNLGDGFSATYKCCDVVNVPNNAVYLYVNYSQLYTTSNFNPYGVKEYTSLVRKEKKEVSPTKTMVPDADYAGYLIYTSNNTPYLIRFEDNNSYTTYVKRVRTGDKIRLKSSYFSALAGYVLTDMYLTAYFTKHTTSSGSASYDDTITIDRDGYVFYTAYGTSEFYEQDDLINTLGGNTGRLYGKKVFFDGDSITMASDANTTGYVEQIQAITGCIAQNLAVDGGTLTSGTVIPGGTPRHHVCESILNSDADTDIFCISGGYNDWGIGQSAVGTFNPQITSDLTQFDTTTLYGALDYIFTWLMLNRTGKPILFIMTHNPLNYRIAGGANLTANITLEEWFGHIKTACNKYSVPIVNLFDNTPLMTKLDTLKAYTVSSDGVHPNTNGYKYFYVPQILAKLNEICPYKY